MTARVMAAIASLLLAAACSSAQPDQEPALPVAPTTSAVLKSATVEEPVHQVSQEAVTTEPPGVATSTTTTKAPGAIEPGDEAPVITVDLETEDLNTDELDALLADLNRILGDLDASLAQDEGDVFDD